MKVIEKIKEEIKSIDNAVEMAGFLDGIRVSAALYCKKEYPDEVIIENGELKDISIYGMIRYIESDILDEI